MSSTIFTQKIYQIMNYTELQTIAVDINGAQDYIEDTVTVTFPASTNPAEETINVFIPFIDDDTNEPINEGFYVLVTINELLSSPTDVANAETIRNGIALVRIEDDDSKYFYVLVTHLITTASLIHVVM